MRQKPQPLNYETPPEPPFVEVRDVVASLLAEASLLLGLMALGGLPRLGAVMATQAGRSSVGDATRMGIGVIWLLLLVGVVMGIVSMMWKQPGRFAGVAACVCAFALFWYSVLLASCLM